MLSIIAFTAGFSAPNSKLLALRGGGVSTDALTTTWAALNTVSGLQGWVAPKSTAEAYGIKDLSEQESFFLRANCGMSIVLAVSERKQSAFCTVAHVSPSNAINLLRRRR